MVAKSQYCAGVLALVMGCLVMVSSSPLAAQQEGITVQEDKVGIGTTNPHGILHVLDDLQNVDVRLQTSKVDGKSLFSLLNDSQIWTIQNNGSEEDRFRIRDATNGLVPFSIEPNTLQDALFLGSSGIGMGTHTPEWNLHLKASGTVISQTESESGGAVQIRMKSDNDNRRIIGLTNVGDVKSQIELGNTFIKFAGPTTVNDNLLFLDLIDFRIGIGTTSPEEKFQVKDGGILLDNQNSLHSFKNDNITTHEIIGMNAFNQIVINRNAISASGGVPSSGILFAASNDKDFQFRNEDNTTQVAIDPGSGNLTLYNGRFLAPDASAVSPGFGFSSAASTGMFLNGTSLSFSTASLDRLQITDSGKIGIGRTPLTHQLEVNGSASKTTAGSWLGNSDARLKKNITPLNGEKLLSDLLKIKGVQYNWREDGKDYNARPTGTNYGLIAQDIQKVFPSEQFVQEDSDGYLSAAYGTYDPIYIEVIRHLSERIEALEKVVMEMKEMKE